MTSWWGYSMISSVNSSITYPKTFGCHRYMIQHKYTVCTHAHSTLKHSSSLYILLCLVDQLSRKLREWHLSLSLLLYKQTTFLICSRTELSTWEPLHIYIPHMCTLCSLVIPAYLVLRYTQLHLLHTHGGHKYWISLTHSHRNFKPYTAIGNEGIPVCSNVLLTTCT